MILPRGFFLHLIDASSHVHAPFIGKKQCQIFSRAKFPMGVEPQGRSVRFLNEVERRRLSRRFTWWERFIAEFRDIFGYSIIALLLSLRIFFVRSSLNLCTRIAANILCFIIFVITFSVKYKYERKGFNLLLFLIDRFFIFFFFIYKRQGTFSLSSIRLVRIRRSWQSEDEFNFELLRNKIDCCSINSYYIVC